MDERAKVKIFKREYIWVFFWKFSVVSDCFGLLRNRSVCFGCFDKGSKHRNKPKYFIFGFTKQTETKAKQILFRFVSVRTENYFCLFRGHPSSIPASVGTVESEGRQMKQCWILYDQKEKNPPKKYYINISRGHYLPCNTYCLVLACIKATIHIRPLRFCHDLANI